MHNAIAALQLSDLVRFAKRIDIDQKGRNVALHTSSEQLPPHARYPRVRRSLRAKVLASHSILAEKRRPPRARAALRHVLQPRPVVVRAAALCRYRCVDWGTCFGL